MLGDRYRRNSLALSERQADPRRRSARSERVNEIDWAHVVEEIEELAELHAALLILARLLEPHASPELHADPHWRSEIVAFQVKLADLPARHAAADRPAQALRTSQAAGALITCGGKPAPASLATCPVTLDQQLNASFGDLQQVFSADHQSP